MGKPRKTAARSDEITTDEVKELAVFATAFVARHESAERRDQIYDCIRYTIENGQTPFNRQLSFGVDQLARAFEGGRQKVGEALWALEKSNHLMSAGARYIFNPHRRFGNILASTHLSCAKIDILSIVNV